MMTWWDWRLHYCTILELLAIVLWKGTAFVCGHVDGIKVRKTRSVGGLGGRWGNFIDLLVLLLI